MRILVIDDDTDILEIISKILRIEDYKVIIASNGKEGLQIIKSTPEIYLVIIDLIMPEKEGIETIREIKEDFPHIKTVAMSGGGRYGSNNYLSLAKFLGADLTLKKPFGTEELLKSVKKLTVEKKTI
jgi:DNA-binding response OmpR family regulator